MNEASGAMLTVRVHCDYDNDCDVVATLTAGEFRGRGEAWLQLGDVIQFANSVAALAATSAGEATLSGGYFPKDKPPHLTVNIGLKPLGRRGHIAVLGELASNLPSHEAQLPHRIAGAIVVEPAALGKFADDLCNIKPGLTVEATVHGTDAA
jgi:hypothetical protein